MSPRRNLLLAGALLVAGAALLSCAPRQKGPPNILFLVVDALRVDHVGIYGYERETTPNLDRLARESVLFTRAYSPGNNTRTSVPAILTGLYPTATGAQKHDDVLNSTLPTLTEALSARGYATGAFVANGSLRPAVGLGRGFDLYHYDPHIGSEGDKAAAFETAVKLQTRALDFLRATGDRPYFVYIHYRDVHGPYVAPPPYDRLFWDPAAPTAGQRPLTPAEYKRIGDDTRLPDPQTLEHYLAQYDGEIRYTDDRIAEFLAELDRMGKLDNTVIVVTADHGEAFLEHHAWDHGNQLYDEELHVPLLIRLPGRRRAGTRIDVPVSGVDLLPTFTALAAAEAPPEIQGRNLLPIIEAGRGREIPLFAAAEGGRRAVRFEGWKLLVLSGRKSPLLFDLARDPRERENLSHQDPEKAAELMELLRRHEEQSRRILAKHPSHREKIDAESEANLKALGYL